MKVNKVELLNYRNYENQVIKFEGGLNVLLGDNAQGKTNLVEAINFCSIGKSFRTSKDKELIQFGKDRARIFLELEKKSGKSNIEIIISNSQKKVVRINSYSILKMGELMGELNCILFSPDNLKMVKEGPQDRRKFLDIDLSQMSKLYFYNLIKYNQILNQRNKLLKSGGTKNSIQNSIAVWDEQLAKVGASIILDRKNFVDSLAPVASDIHSKITDAKEKLCLSYEGIDASSLEEIIEKFKSKLSSSFEKDITLGYTTIGPHRDDIKIICNGLDVRTYGSQGQQRTSALSMKLAELEYFNIEKQEYPVLILDDVLSELDEQRSRLLLESTDHVQTIMTGTQFTDYKSKYTIFTVKNGKCERK